MRGSTLNTDAVRELQVIDSHTGGEPTRVIVDGMPDLGQGAMGDRLALMREHWDHLRAAAVSEPRGSDVIVGALLCEPVERTSAAGVVFFNNVGYLSMCGHGAIGLAATLHFLGRMPLGSHILETPAGKVTLTLHDAHRVSVSNVVSYRYRKDVALDVPGVGELRGDIAWGGNWFFLVSDHGQALELSRTRELTDFSWAIRHALEAADIRGAGGALIDHVELFGPPSDERNADSRNFVLCPGGAYDRSPCGTGTSAKLACLLEDGMLGPGDCWRQESITGSVFEARAELTDEQLRPVITGTAYITARSTLHIDRDDPFRFGLSAN
ncbi:MAG: proline racemase family protein [Halieaceae bacterium]|jgi:4-hydroxyproline epimerase|nr:proline racemase family protein [Halieaceae bacterium]